MRFRNSAIFLVAILMFSAFSAFAQESEAVVVDEVVAQVNDGVLTLSRINREIKEVTEAMVQQGKTPEAAKAEIEGRRAELIANLINEELIIQKGKELGVEKDVTAYVNQEMLRRMKEFNLKNLEALYEEMRKAGVNPDEFKESLGKRYMQDAVLRNDVDSKTYFAFTSKELKDYYEKNKVKFTKPEKVSFSEIFLNFAGRDENQVREKAKQIVAQLRSGADFGKLAVENSDRPEAQQNKGKIDRVFTVSELQETIAKPMKSVKVGGVSDPIEVEGGIEIVRVDSREEASQDSVFDEDQVRQAMLAEKGPEARKKYMRELRRDAYIKISEPYRAMVTPILFKDDQTAEVKKDTK